VVGRRRWTRSIDGTCHHTRRATFLSLESFLTRFPPPRSLAHSSLSAASSNDNENDDGDVRHAVSCFATLGRVQLARQRSRPLWGWAIGYRYIRVYKTRSLTTCTPNTHTYTHIRLQSDIMRDLVTAHNIILPRVPDTSDVYIWTDRTDEEVPKDRDDSFTREEAGNRLLE
jgi:hypothetical protein